MMLAVIGGTRRHATGEDLDLRDLPRLTMAAQGDLDRRRSLFGRDFEIQEFFVVVADLNQEGLEQRGVAPEARGRDGDTHVLT
jgi:hypothetical protein